MCPKHSSCIAFLQALLFAKKVREVVGDLHCWQRPIHLSSSPPKLESADGITGAPDVVPPLIAIYLDRSKTYIKAVLAVLASG